MEFFNHQHCKYTGVKGFITIYNDAVRYRYMITEKAKKKAEIVYFFRKYGLEPTISAFKTSKTSVYRWQDILKENNGKIESLSEKSTSPRNKRKRNINPKILDFVILIRKEHPRIGKEKITPLLRAFCLKENIKSSSVSTVGRIITDLKKNGKLSFGARLSLSAKTGRLIERRTRKRKKLRRKGYQPEKAGDLIQIDTVVKFINGIKRYIVTAIDLKSSFAFAYGYSFLSSNTARDFFEKLELVSPFAVKRIQNDNGLEFLKNFQNLLEKRSVVQFFNYPRRPQMNAKVERFNRTIQEEFANYHLNFLAYDLNRFNRELIDWLLWYNTERPHWSINLKSPLQYLIQNLGFSQMWWTDTIF